MSDRSIRESFEDNPLPSRWQPVSGGAVALSERHLKDGGQSLRWIWTGGSRLRREELAVDPAETPGAGIEGWIYLEKPLPGRLTFRLGTAAELAAGTPPYAFRFGLDFSGWRMFRVSLERDCRVSSTPSPQAPVGNAQRSTGALLEIVPPPEAPDGCLWLDALVIGAGVSGQRSADYQVPEHAGGLGGWCEHWPLHYARQTPVEPLPTAITDTQKRDFGLIVGRYRKWLLGEDPDLTRPLLRAGAEQFQAYMRRGWTELERLQLVRDADGRIIGPGLVKNFGSPTSFKHLFYDILMPIVFDYKVNGNAAARATALELFDYLHDQGWAEGSALGDLWLLPLGFAPYCHAVVLMRDDLRATGRLDVAVRAARWYLTFGKTFTRFDEKYVETNADALRGIVFTSLALILAMDDTPQKVQHMRGWLAWYNDALQISPRFAGLLKPDGLGFHHQGVYAGAYTTCAYEFCTLIVWLLHGTGFAAAPATVANLKRALLTQDILTNKYDIPYAVMGRMPHPGIRILSAYAYLALASEPPDPDLAGIFMRLWDPRCACLGAGDKGTNYLPQVLNVDLDAQQGKFLFYQTPGRLQILQGLADRGLPATPPPQGFWSKPWGALAIHRRDEWMVAVKGWSQYVWDFECHPKAWAPVEENVFARFWSYGTLQPITHGQPRNPVASGWNLDRGWDWCRWPGATTPHLTLAELYDPKRTWECRFFSAATFVGGVSCDGRNGLFALKLHEHYYDPTFRAFKTCFFFDNTILCLGSNIQSRDDAHSVATTLFQSWMPDPDMPVAVNGERVAAFPYESRGTSGQALTLMDPYGNGYFLPDGGAVRLRRGLQRSRDAWNRGDTEGAFSTAWLDHGQPPRDDGYGEVRYHYVMLVQTTPAALAAYAAAPPYRVLLQNHQAHIVEAAPSPLSGRKTTAYALFETDWVIPWGALRKTDTPVLVMMKETDDGLLLSLADPDLHLPKRRNMGYLDDEANATPSRPSAVRLDLRGRWRLAQSCASVQSVLVRDDVTTLTVACRHGLSVEVLLGRATAATAVT